MHKVQYTEPIDTSLPPPPPDGPFVRWDETAGQALGRGWRCHLRNGVEDGFYVKENDALKDLALIMMFAAATPVAEIISQ
jgi:hypothetical protein